MMLVLETGNALLSKVGSCDVSTALLLGLSPKTTTRTVESLSVLSLVAFSFEWKNDKGVLAGPVPSTPPLNILSEGGTIIGTNISTEASRYRVCYADAK
jgi:hypothetical protein